MMNKSELIICEASELADQLTALLQILFERGTGNGLHLNDPVIGLAYNMASKVSIFLINEEARQDKEETDRAKHRRN